MTKRFRLHPGVWLLLCFVVLIAGPLITIASGKVSFRGDWATATHRPSGLAPDPAVHREAVVQVYGGRTFGWRGAFAVHTWLAAKPTGADRYTRYEVIGWYARAGRSASGTHGGAPGWRDAIRGHAGGLRCAPRRAQRVNRRPRRRAQPAPLTPRGRLCRGAGAREVGAQLGPPACAQ